MIEACRLRLRPILMTSFAFILGVLPLVISSGSGSEMRQAVGVAVFFGMIGVTLFGLLFTPIFYVVVRNLAEGRTGKPKAVRGRGISPCRRRSQPPRPEFGAVPFAITLQWSRPSPGRHRFVHTSILLA